VLAAEPQFMRSHDLWPAARSRDGGADAGPRFRLDSGCRCERGLAREYGQSKREHGRAPGGALVASPSIESWRLELLELRHASDSRLEAFSQRERYTRRPPEAWEGKSLVLDSIAVQDYFSVGGVRTHVLRGAASNPCHGYAI